MSFKRLGVAWLAVLTMTCAAPQAFAADYPNRAIRVVDAFPAGGSTDYLARQISSRLGPTWNVPVVVENRGGAFGQIGVANVARSDPDGYSFLVIPNELWTVAPRLYKQLPYDTHAQLMPVAPIAQVPMVMAVSASLPVSNVKEFIAYARQHPGKVGYGSAGAGSIHHLSGELFASMAGVSLMHVPYKGTAPAVVDVASGQIAMVFSPITAVLQHIQSGRLKAIAVAGSQRALALPNVPTVAESGVPGYQTTLRVSLLAPRGLPAEIRTKWFDEMRKITTEASMRDALALQGIEPDVIEYDAWLRRFEQDEKQWADVIKRADIRVE